MLSKPEPNEERMNFYLPPTMKRRIVEYAKENNVSEASALRHIITLFFDSGFGETKENHCCHKRKEAV